MSRLIDADELENMKFSCGYNHDGIIYVPLLEVRDNISRAKTAYDVEKVVAEVKKLDLDGVSMVEDGKYRLVRKNEVISIIQTNGVCNGRHNTCADCYKKDCTLSTENTFTDKWSEQIRKGGVNE